MSTAVVERPEALVERPIASLLPRPVLPGEVCPEEEVPDDAITFCIHQFPWTDDAFLATYEPRAVGFYAWRQKRRWHVYVPPEFWSHNPDREFARSFTYEYALMIARV